MPASDGVQNFRVWSRREGAHHGRVVAEATFEAAAIAYAEHLPVHVEDETPMIVTVHALDNGEEHDFLVRHGLGPVPTVTGR